MTSFIGLIIVLGLVVLVHELGHFLAARKFGVKVVAFSIGFGLGKPLLKWKDKRGTEWRLGWLPLGGYVELYEDKDNKGKKGSLSAAPNWKKAIIMVSGVALNFLLAWVIFLFLFAAKPEQIIKPTIGTVVENSLAERAGVQPGWTVRSISGNPINEWSDLIKTKTYAGNKIVRIDFDNGETVRLLADKPWGIIPQIPENPEFKKRTPLGVISRATTETYQQSKLLFIVIRQLITGDRDSKQLGSFIMIAEMAGMALNAGIFALLAMIAMLSINLGVINLLPIPALDGGHLLIILIESVTRRKLNEKAKNYVILAGWAVIIALMALALKNDIMRVLGL
ncbi:MAG: RIP metalloprotease RseP [Alphaproteobacteria bacterium]|nr:RIP metalloprotease RseP [Alphaproteobacteria bacterium]